MSTPFKMTGMTFKEGQTPMRFINFKNLAKKVSSSKLGKTKLGETVSEISGKIGDVQEKFVSWKKRHGLKTEEYDASVESETVSTSEESSGTEESEAVDLTKKGGLGPRETFAATLPIAPGLPGTPVLKTSPVKIYKKSVKKLQKKY